MDIFRRREDFERFLEYLAAASRRAGADIHGYALMNTHAHLVITPRIPGAIGRAMHVFETRYVRYFNRLYGRTGTLFEGRYRMSHIGTDDYWFSCMRYVELNPVRGGIVRRPENYPWSSYSAHALGIPDGLVTPHPLYDRLGNGREERQQRWRDMCARQIDTAELAGIRYAIHFGKPLARATPPDAVIAGAEQL